MIDPDLIGFAIALVVLLLPVAGVLIYVRARDRRVVRHFENSLSRR